MRLIRFMFIIAALLMIPVYTWAASSCTQTYTTADKDPKLRYVDFAWTAHTDGSFTSVASTQDIDGYIVSVITDPGTPAPTDDYDITLTNELGYDVMGGTLANRDTSTTENAISKIYTGGSDTIYGSPLNIGTLTLNISNNSVNGAQGVVRVIYQKE